MRRLIALGLHIGRTLHIGIHVYTRVVLEFIAVALLLLDDNSCAIGAVIGFARLERYQVAIGVNHGRRIKHCVGKEIAVLDQVRRHSRTRYIVEDKDGIALVSMAHFNLALGFIVVQRRALATLTEMRCAIAYGLCVVWTLQGAFNEHTRSRLWIAIAERRKRIVGVVTILGDTLGVIECTIEKGARPKGCL